MNKEIEEMSAYLSQFTPILSENNCHYVAEQAYKDGYRRESEVMSNNSEVMSKKETEDLATEIYTLFRSRSMSRALARHLYDKGWRKQKEGEWKIKSEIHKLIDDVDEEIFVECSFCHRRFPVPYELDDEKIFKYARENYPYCNCGAKMKGGD